MIWAFPLRHKKQFRSHYTAFNAVMVGLSLLTLLVCIYATNQKEFKHAVLSLTQLFIKPLK